MKYYLLILVLQIFFLSCKSPLEKIPLDDIQAHRNYQDSLINIDSLPFNKLNRLKSLIGEYRSHVSEWSTNQNYSYYMLRLYTTINELPFKGFLYDTSAQKLRYPQEYKNVYDSILIFGNKALEDNSKNVYAAFALASSMYFNRVRASLSKTEIPFLAKDHSQEYNELVNKIITTADSYESFDTTFNKSYVRSLYEISLFFFDYSTMFVKNYRFESNNFEKTQALDLYGRIYEKIRLYKDFAFFDYNRSFINKNILPQVALARAEIDRRNKILAIRKAEEDFNQASVNHKYSFCDPENSVFGLIELYGSDSYTQAVNSSMGMISGRGTFIRDGYNIYFNRISGIAVNGVATIRPNNGTIEIILPTGGRYLQDDDGYYIKNSVSTVSNN